MNWIELKALNVIYANGSITANQSVLKSGEFNYLINSARVLDKEGNKILALPDFATFYESKYLEKYNLYHDFLVSRDLLKPQTRYQESDINILINIQSRKDSGELEYLRQQIIEYDESVRGVSQMFFKNEKYLDDKPSLVHALKQILEISHFSTEKDQQYIYKLECHDPNAIVLCENLDFLTKPNKPRKYSIELWYAGGKNVNKLEFSDTRGLPIFYSCDWDYDGLFIIYPLVKAKIPAIELLIPDGIPKGIVDTDHDSKWGELAKLDQAFFDEPSKTIVNSLVKNNQWIIEESNNLINMLINYGFLRDDVNGSK